MGCGSIPQIPRQRAPHRSRVTSGSKLLPLTDARSATATRFRDLFDHICGDLGGIDQLSERQRQLVRRAAMLSAESERMEAMAVRGEEFDADLYGTMCDRLGRVFGRIGLKRVARDAVTLKDYIKPAKPPPVEIEAETVESDHDDWDGGAP